MKVQGLDVFAFKTKALFQKWLSRSFDSKSGIWLRFYKKASGKPTVTYQEALQIALCFGWIDGHVKSYDEHSWIQKFTPRRSKSIWSKRNTLLVAQLIKEKKMKPSGLKVVEAAKADGRWAKAYASPKNMKLPKDFLSAVKKNKKASGFLKTLGKSKLYAIGFRLHTAKKAETRARRMKNIIEQLAKKNF